jgi:2-succinyl-5-enolpyruvyl-6-hydroxy-3-cyclohexene-1-carboxylate synthase
MRPNQHIAELGPLLELAGVRYVIISPGSRNAPLTQLFTSGERFHCFSVVDERSAGYMALGMALHLQKPVVVVTTSGTAVLNLSPAIAEAYHQRVPLVVLTADRPVEPVKQFNNQFIDQMAPYYNYTKGFYELPFEPRDDQELKQVVTDTGKLVMEAVSYPPGPVHINVPLLEPLYETLPGPILESQLTGLVPEPRETGDGGEPLTGTNGGKVLVLAGAGLYPAQAERALEDLSRNQPFVAVAENLANLHSGSFIGHPEILLAGAGETELQELKPDLVIGLGGQVVSKKLKNFIQSDPGIRTLVPEGNPSGFIQKLSQHTDERPAGYLNEYLHAWKTVEARQLERSGRALETLPFGNLTAIAEILRRAPAGTVIHLGNSSTIRYSQLVPVRNDLTYYSNRGTSGIDGCVSTAVGAAMVSEGLHLLLVGDLSFVYDSNALWNHRFPGNLRIIVINDGGGDIFRILEGPGRMEFFEEFSVTHHPVSIELLAQAFGRGFGRVSGTEELTSQLGTFMQPDSSLSVLEVDTTGSENSRIFKSFYHKIQ